MSMEKQAKNWRHYVARDTGECTVVRPEGDRERISYQLGIIETGSSRVFAGYFITVTMSEDEEITGEDSGSLVAALWRLARNVSARGLRLRCAGMSGQWRESGLSQNTGWGYFGRHQQPMHMMDLTPEGGGPDTIDEMIREAVGSMKIGLAEKAA